MALVERRRIHRRKITAAAFLNSYPPISDYALVGDCRTGALVSRDGSIDWLCLPHFDSPSCFNRLLDRHRGGYCSVRPTEPYRATRSYRPDTAVLTTDFRTADGVARLTDLMPASENGRFPLRQLIRRIEAVEGRMEVELLVKPRPDDGRTIPCFKRRGRTEYCADFGGRLLCVAIDAPVDEPPGELSALVRLEQGQAATLWLAYAEDAPAVYPRLAEAADAIEETVSYWTSWTGRCRQTGPLRDATVRSAVTLKLLSHAPTGAIVAAPTTSLPERVGGDLNWDYRYCWLRDASFTAHAFLRLGFEQEAVAFTQWITHATALTYPALQVLYTLHGEASIPERSCSRLEGYRGSRPVRLGNEAATQSQLDVYGEVLDTLLLHTECGYAVDRDTKRWLVRVGDLLVKHWAQPDHGIWEIRGAPRHYVHSKVMCWVALDRLERLAGRLGLAASIETWARAREAIRHIVLRSGYSAIRRSFVQVLGGTRLDAASLLFGTCGFLKGQDPRMLSTIATIQRSLSQGPLVYRYLPDQPGSGQGEGRFLPCSFWMAEALACSGRRDEAEEMVVHLRNYGNDVGLFPEEIQDYDGTFLGNFPLALTHVAHLRALLKVDRPAP
jgi:GH15 family glucan-1,4-alpha-glucosidase